ncbi:MAG: hypothetical protein CMK08_04730 [Ponticaulis sp.]|nr:hypothetical protein [Ponticaulis sp.]MBN03465.1 hypothetical protein [Ponticaulis sp.]
MIRQGQVNLIFAVIFGVGFLTMVGYILMPNTVGWAIAPQSVARVPLCMSSDGDWHYENTCRFDVEFQFCFENREGESYDWRCETAILSEDETVDASILHDSLTNYAGFSINTCRVPYAPAPIENNSLPPLGCYKTETGDAS